MIAFVIMRKNINEMKKETGIDKQNNIICTNVPTSKYYRCYFVKFYSYTF